MNHRREGTTREGPIINHNEKLLNDSFKELMYNETIEQIISYVLKSINMTDIQQDISELKESIAGSQESRIKLRYLIFTLISLSLLTYLCSFVIIYYLYPKTDSIISSQYVIENATQLESPWLTFLSVYDLPCAEALVKNQFVVTAAHCFDTLKYDDFNKEKRLQSVVKIKLGEWKTDRDPDCNEDIDKEICDNFIEIPPKNVIVHEEYGKLIGMNEHKNGIAIIKLSWPPRESELI
ncbi:unnamed protein product [Chironomus riparius]|uniref:Peptidase S1 domain-containing protein n=1 Tax=Chironomus riparius TaxID=315576 RepID=A0A9N9S604_9DIPT|nr:unnamed protein product [Chironomus riparius]